MSDFDRETGLFCRLSPSRPPRYLENCLRARIAERTSIEAASRTGQFAHFRVVTLDGENDRGILICGTGIGVSISANQVPGIRAALTHDTSSAERAAKSNNAQIINMGARIIGPEVAKSIVDVWLASEFDPAGSSAGNVKAIDKLDSAKLT